MAGKRLPKRAARPKPELHPTVTKPVSVKVKDRKGDGFSLVALDSVQVKINERRMPPGTYARIDKKSKTLQCLVTVMPGDTHVAWDSCGTCHEYFTLCKCRAGVAACRSVEYIFDKTTAMKNGEDWSWMHPNYRGSLTRDEREARQDREARRTRPFDPTRVRQAPTAPVEEAAPKKTITKTKTLSKKPLLKKRDASNVTTSDGGIDLGKMNQEARQTDAQMLDLLRKSMKPEGKKPLAKKPLQKKPLRKKQ